MKKVAVGLSGGVDSSVAAALLIDQGYEVTAFYIEAYNEPGCRTDQDKKDALRVAIQLGIPFESLDVRREYREKVIEYFYREYQDGRTPNPDIVCNREIKFGIFYDEMIKRGYDYVATGHYARIAVSQCHGSTVSHLQRAKDRNKDQSYFLWAVARDKLEHVLFPIGEMMKSEVREEAKRRGLVTADKPDSMGVCMMGQLSMNDLLRDKLGEKRGEVIYQVARASGSQSFIEPVVVGEHKGLWFYTIGERRGIVLDKKKMKKMGLKPEELPPLYVIHKDTENNRLFIGTKEETRKKNLRVMNYELWGDITRRSRLYVRIRNLGELYTVSQCHRVTENTWEITTQGEMEGVAEGQSGVIYMDTGKVGEEVVVGGGVIG